MAAFTLPYGRTGMPLTVPGHRIGSVLELSFHDDPVRISGEALIRESIEHPIDSPRLSELARGKRNAVLILSDHTRPVPSRLIVPPLLRELRRYNPEIDVTLLVATGCHRGTTHAELAAKLGEEILRTEKIVIHDCDDKDNLIALGTLPSGGPLIVNKLAAETDLLLAEGFIEPHFFAGFSGGRKSVLPGIAGRSAVLGNHCGAFIDHPLARTGILDGNPIHRDMEYAAGKLRLAFITNVVLGQDKQPVAAFSGHFREAHRKGCEYLSSRCLVQAEPAEITITTNGGYPLDQNVYQSVKCMTAAEACTKPGGVIIALSECSDGCGGDFFFRAVRDAADPAALYREAAGTPQSGTVPDQWQYQILARILMHYTVILVADEKNRPVIEAMKMRYASTAEEALRMAEKIAGPDALVNIVPDGVSVIVQTK